MLARGTRAGQSVEQAVRLVASESGGVLGPEFRRCSQQLEMGRGFDKALKTLAGRVCIVEMRILATTLIVQRQTGGRLSETLDRMAEVVRDRLTAHRQIKASSGAGRTSTLVIASVAPIAYLAMFLFHRPHVQYLFDDPLGRLLLLLALVLEVIGLGWVFYLLRREE
jgi:tight adherence protein B